jgi:hypothetical protein
MPLRSHLFISYATEDSAFVEWLCLRLLNEGYRVWCDRLKLLGGESYPTDIDEAICSRTFRFVAVLSKSSLRKANPLKERTLALQIARERKEDFLIPLNLDGLAPSQLGWMQADLTFIPFQNWHDGLAQLLKALERAVTPKSDAPCSVAQLLQNTLVIEQVEERLWSNLVAIKSIPKCVRRFEHQNAMPLVAALELKKVWPHLRESATVCWSFVPPPSETRERYKFANRGTCRDWRRAEGPDINFYNIGKKLMNATLQHALLGAGLAFEPDSETCYFGNREEFARFRFRTPDAESWIKAVGLRSFRTVNGRITFRYHLAPLLRTWLDVSGRDFVHIRIGLHLTDTQGHPIPPGNVQSRRKAICRSWWNYEWWARIMATLQLLGGSEDKIVLCPDADQPLVLDRFPISILCETRLNEEYLRPEKDVREDVDLLTRAAIDEEYLEEDDEQEVGRATSGQ